MDVLGGKTQIGLKPTSHGVTVPDNDKAKLMYYLKCVCILLKLDDPQINRLRRFNDYSLSDEQTDALTALCILFSPDVLMDKCMFHSEELCGDHTNMFFDLSIAQTHLTVIDSILIGGQRRRVQKIMTFKMGWIDTYWRDPLKSVVTEREREKERERENKRQQQLQQQREQQQRQQREREQQRQQEEEQKRQQQQEEQKRQQEQQQLQIQQLQLQVQVQQQQLQLQQQQQRQQQGGGCCVIL